MSDVLYVIMRNDLASMNPGKACAQCNHAGTQFLTLTDKSLYTGWLNQANGFGTVIVLTGSIKQIDDAINSAKLFNYTAEKVMDPTYPVTDGEVTHYIPLVTCGYIFGDKKAVSDFVSGLKLMA